MINNTILYSIKNQTFTGVINRSILNFTLNSSESWLSFFPNNKIYYTALGNNTFVNSILKTSNNITVLNTIPSITLLFPYNNYGTSHDVNIKWNIFDIDNLGYTVYLYGSQEQQPTIILNTWNNVNNSELEYSWNDLTNGDWYYYLKVNDTYNITNSSTYKLTFTDIQIQGGGNSGGGEITSIIISQLTNDSSNCLYIINDELTYWTSPGKSQTKVSTLKNMCSNTDINISIDCIGDLCKRIVYNKFLMISKKSSIDYNISVMVLDSDKNIDNKAILFLNNQTLKINLISSNTLINTIQDKLQDVITIPSLNTGKQPIKITAYWIYIIVFLGLVLFLFLILRLLTTAGLAMFISIVISVLSELIYIIIKIFYIFQNAAIKTKPIDDIKTNKDLLSTNCS